jgi:hypothetical protein
VASGDVVVRSAELAEPVAGELIELLNAELSERYPEDGANHFRLDAGEVAPGRGAFLASSGCSSVGPCAAAGYTEIERFGEYADSPLSLCMAKTLG